MQQCVLDALIGPSGSAHAGDRYLVYGPPLGLNDQAVALRNASNRGSLMDTSHGYGAGPAYQRALAVQTCRFTASNCAAGAKGWMRLRVGQVMGILSAV